MAATVQIHRLNSTGPTSTDITSTTNRASTSDVVAPGTSDPIPIPSVGSTSITAATNASPISITATGHGLTNGDVVKISGVGGNTNANGTWKCHVVDANTIELTNRAGNAAYTSGGTVRKVNTSFWVVTQLNCTVTPAGTINNIKWYSDGANSQGTGVTTLVGTATSYIQATGTVGTTGDPLTELTTVGGYGYGATLTIDHTKDAFSYTSASPLSVTGSISNPSTGAFGDRVVYQVTVDSSAGPGTLTAETFTWQYDET